MRITEPVLVLAVESVSVTDSVGRSLASRCHEAKVSHGEDGEMEKMCPRKGKGLGGVRSCFFALVDCLVVEMLNRTSDVSKTTNKSTLWDNEKEEAFVRT